MMDNVSLYAFFFFSISYRLLVVTGFIYNRIKCSMKSYKLSELTQTEVERLKARPRIDFSSIFSTVSFWLFSKF
jgi:hypothetical protein